MNSPKARNIADWSSKLIEQALVARLLQVAAWLAFALIVFVTLAPLQYRPVVSQHAQLERFAAFAMVGLFFGLAYPRRLIVDWSFLIVAAGLLEGLQHLTGDRHGHLRDAVAKALGATFGIGAALLIWAVVAYYRPLFGTPQPAGQTGGSTLQHQNADPRS